MNKLNRIQHFSEILESQFKKELEVESKNFSDMGVTSVETLKQNNDAVVIRLLPI